MVVECYGLNLVCVACRTYWAADTGNCFEAREGTTQNTPHHVRILTINDSSTHYHTGPTGLLAQVMALVHGQAQRGTPKKQRRHSRCSYLLCVNEKKKNRGGTAGGHIYFVFLTLLCCV